ncbi:MAG: PfkB family carbohydrate kinase [Opitutales bacterium]|nr:PfkB family carbohydrate kinase [Opitutales bacterium]
MPTPEFQNHAILVIGDLMLDHYIWGDATRISPEAPVPVVHVDRDSYVPGGAANVASNLAGLGVRTGLLGRCGNDDGGHSLQKLLKKDQIDLLPQSLSEALPTIVKTRVIVQRQQMCRIDREKAPCTYTLSPNLSDHELKDITSRYDAIIISDYAKGVIDDSLLHRLREILQTSTSQSQKINSKPLLVADPKPRRHLDLSGFDLLTPNRSEALELAGLHSNPSEDFPDREVCHRIYQKYRPHNLVITLGSEGMLLCQEGQVIGRLPTEAKEVFDVSGAGDTVIATLTACLTTGMGLEASASFANKAAGIVVSHVGTTPITLAELQNS